VVTLRLNHHHIALLHILHILHTVKLTILGQGGAEEVFLVGGVVVLQEEEIREVVTGLETLVGLNEVGVVRGDKCWTKKNTFDCALSR
jgi:hypothetical protein